MPEFRAGASLSWDRHWMHTRNGQIYIPLCPGHRNPAFPDKHSYIAVCFLGVLHMFCRPSHLARMVHGSLHICIYQRCPRVPMSPPRVANMLCGTYAYDGRRPKHQTRQDNAMHCAPDHATCCAAGERALLVAPVDGLDRQVADRIPQDLQLQVQGRPCNRKGLGAAAKTAAGL